MEKVYKTYIFADRILKELDRHPLKMIKLTSIDRWYDKSDLVSILSVNGFVKTELIDYQQYIKITSEGQDHLINGGFIRLLDLGSQIKTVTFKTHLENQAGLIGTFGVLNAIILFSASKDFIGNDENSSFFTFGIQLVSLAMFILSIAVLTQIIKSTPKQEEFEFKVFQATMIATTTGISIVFICKFGMFLLGTTAVILLLSLMIVISSKSEPLYFKIPWRFEVNKKNRRLLIVILAILFFASSACFLCIYFPDYLDGLHLDHTSHG